MRNLSSLFCQHYEVHKEVAKQLSLLNSFLQSFVTNRNKNRRFINDAHQKIGHNKSANVTQEACHLFLTFDCEECHKKRARKLPKSLVVKPLISTNLMSRAQVDLINFQTISDEVLHFESADVILGGRSGNKTTRNLFNVRRSQHSAIRQRSYALPKSLVAAAKTEEEIEEFLTSQEANDEESLNRDGKNYEKNESNIMKHFSETFIKAQKEAASGQTRAAAKMTR
ncbi:hypothetical protein T03_6345 [Trichinella britovi]|uniref:Uncharacterized protein n=1 Tax=Trichinella britovi TaxID=45882 RepID=A0A0V1C9X9_TRIBR|nr:hypothetical protein T03_6345 [Trichinella britovi]